MKTLSIFALVTMMFSLSLANAQVASSSRGQYPRLLVDGKIVDMNGKNLGSITKDGEIMSGEKLIALISATGVVTYANGKGVAGVIKKNVFTSQNETYVATIEKDGAVIVNDDFAAFVDKGYVLPSHGCILHFFFGRDNQMAKEIDEILY